CILQAADGIRYGHVTGVRTCALPIRADRRRGEGGRVRERSRPRNRPSSPGLRSARHGTRSAVSDSTRITMTPAPLTQPDRRVSRSEERRVGKEWRSQGGGYGGK